MCRNNFGDYIRIIGFAEQFVHNLTAQLAIYGRDFTEAGKGVLFGHSMNAQGKFYVATQVVAEVFLGGAVKELIRDVRSPCIRWRPDAVLQ